MRERTWKARVKKVLTDEQQEPELWHYFSFADTEFRGAVIIFCHGIADGLLKINMLGCNPHGQVMAAPIPDEALPDLTYRNRLLTKAEIQEFWPDAKSLREFEAEEAAAGPSGQRDDKGE